jgi:hypothetical protein
MTLAQAVVRVSYRTLDAADRGPCYTFDIDKTYLDTDFSSLSAALKIPLELAIDKRPYPGVPILIRALQRGTAATGRDRPVFFLSASPKQMRGTLERRLVLDEIGLDGITLKDWAHVLRRRGPRGLRDQLGYKLWALMQARRELPAGTFDVLFGDDTESDPRIYDFYARVVAGECRGGALAEALRREGVRRPDALALVEMSEQLGAPSRVHRTFIHRVRGRTLPESVIAYDTPLLPALWLVRDGLIAEDTLAAICRAAVRSGVLTFARALALTREIAPALVETALRDWG